MPIPNGRDVASRLLVLRALLTVSHTVPPPDVRHQMRRDGTGARWREFVEGTEEMGRHVVAHLDAYGLLDHASPSESTLFRTPAAEWTEREHIDATWRGESAFVLWWALGRVPELARWDEEAPEGWMEAVPSDDLEEFLARSRLRPADDVTHARDIAEMWHWRSRTRQLEEEKRISAAERRRYVSDAAHWLHEERFLDPPMGDDFPALGKAYRDLDDEEWSFLSSIAEERHFALNWLCGEAPENRWDDTPTDT